MKKLLKVLGIASIFAAVLGFGFVACDNGGGSGGGENPPPTEKSLFEKISAMGGKIVAENFDAMADGTKIEKLPDSYTWGTNAGAIYAQYDDATDNFTVTGGKAVQAASGKNGSLYIDLGKADGIIEGCVDVAVSALGLKWNLVSFKNTKDGSTDATKYEPFLFSVYMNNSDGTISYTFDGGQTEKQAKASVKFATGTSYTIHYVINVASGAVKVWVDDTLIVDDNGDFEGLAFVELISSKSGERKLTIDNIAVAMQTATAKDLKDAATAQVEEIATALDAMKGSGWTSTETEAALTAAKTKVEAAIAAVADDADLEEAEDALGDALGTAYEAIVAALQAEFKAQADAYADEKYSGNTSLDDGKTAAAAVIEAVEDIEDFAEALAEAKRAIDDVCAVKVTLTLNGTALTSTPTECNDGQTIASEAALKTLTGYTLATGKGIKGWYTDAAKTTAATFPITISEDTTLYADVGTSYVFDTTAEGADFIKADNPTVLKSGQKFGTSGFFEFVDTDTYTESPASVSSKFEGGKTGTWEDGYEFTNTNKGTRFSLNKITVKTSSGTTTATGEYLKFTTTNAKAVIKVWYISNKKTMFVYASESPFTKIVDFECGTTDADANKAFLLNKTIADAGTYFFGIDGGANYIFKIEVID